MNESLESEARIVYNLFKANPHLIIPKETFKKAIWNGNTLPVYWENTVYQWIYIAGAYTEAHDKAVIRCYPGQGYKWTDNEYEKFLVYQKRLKRERNSSGKANRLIKRIDPEKLPEIKKKELERFKEESKNVDTVLDGIKGNVEMVLDGLKDKIEKLTKDPEVKKEEKK
jgi:hypothetical protein